jgi:hypothetical protein
VNGSTSSIAMILRGDRRSLAGIQFKMTQEVTSSLAALLFVLSVIRSNLLLLLLLFDHDCPRRVRVRRAKFGIVWLHRGRLRSSGSLVLGQWDHYYKKGELVIFERIDIPMAEIRCNKLKPIIHHQKPKRCERRMVVKEQWIKLQVDYQRSKASVE